MNTFNLIVSTYRFREEEAHDEILDLLEYIGDQDAECEITEIKGILLVQTSIEAATVIEKLKGLTSTDPWEVRYVLRVLPVMRAIPTEIDDICLAVSEMVDRIGAQDSFRITIEKRHSSLESRKVIEAVAARVQRRVDLDNPSWVILVQIVGSVTGVSIIRPGQIFSSIKEKRR